MMERERGREGGRGRERQKEGVEKEMEYGFIPQRMPNPDILHFSAKNNPNSQCYK